MIQHKCTYRKWQKQKKVCSFRKNFMQVAQHSAVLRPIMHEFYFAYSFKYCILTILLHIYRNFFRFSLFMTEVVVYPSFHSSSTPDFRSKNTRYGVLFLFIRLRTVYASILYNSIYMNFDDRTSYKSKYSGTKAGKIEETSCCTRGLFIPNRLGISHSWSSSELPL